MDILVVDDSKTILSMITFILEKDGYSVKTCLSAEDALDLLKTEDVKVIITDINMPGIGGKELIKQVRKEPKYQNTIIIVNSAMAVTKIPSSKVNHWISKPVNPHKLSILLKSLLI